jgi:LPXTG-motif cell wall-anchored protein
MTTLPNTTTEPSWIVTRVIDGDTVELSNGEQVRLIGIDAPETGSACAATATATLRQLVERQLVRLKHRGPADRDQYKRLLRYMEREEEQGTFDVGRLMIKLGLARARFDSRDGHGAHPRERDYIAVDAASPNCNDATRSQIVSPPPDTLPDTGSNNTAVAAGLLLIAGGVAITLTTRRRRAHD